MNKKIIVTGVTGQVGSLFADFLLEQDYTVIGTVRNLSVPNYENIDHIKSNKFILENMDLGDAASINLVVEKHRPDYFIGCAANSFVGDSWKCPEQHIDFNCSGVLRELEAIKRFSPFTRFYNFGSSEEMSGAHNISQNENYPLQANSPYATSKICARNIVKTYRESYNLYAVQGWSFNSESCRRGRKFITRKITSGVAKIRKAIDTYINKRLSGGELSIVDGIEPIVVGNLESVRDWSHVSDVILGVWYQLNQDIYRKDIDLKDTSWGVLIKNLREYVLASGKTHSIRDFIQKSFDTADILIKDANPERLPPCIDNTDKNGKQIAYTLQNGQPVVLVSQEFYRPNDVNYLCGDSTKARTELSWQPKISFDQLVKDMVLNDISLLK